MSHTPSVSAIIPTFNGRRFLQPCLQSLQDQTQQVGEIIVVDDASTDGTAEWLEREWPAVHVVRRPANGGYAAAVNDGILASSGELIAVLNDDLECRPTCFAQWMAGLNTVPPVPIAAPKILFAEAAGVINSTGLAPIPTGQNLDRGYGCPDGPEWDRPRMVFGACGAAMLVRREVFDVVGLFDSRFFMYFEDVEWAFRAQRLGYTCRFVPGAVVEHHEGGSRGALPRPMLYYHARNRLWVVLMHFPASLLVRFGPRLLWATLRQLGGDVTRGTTASWRGTFAALGGIKRCLKRRELLWRANPPYSADLYRWLRGNEVDTKNINMHWRDARDSAG